mmetsp:Transcript_15963/g.24732  ORF Transcript_15963/g.24732 Transcript_15963/m.24732 type:complete len:93 (-) Transcript_15963:833-1111(-)
MIIQVFEFAFLAKLMLSQRDKSLEQIFYQHSNRTVEGCLYKWIAAHQDPRNCFLQNEIGLFILFWVSIVAYSVLEGFMLALIVGNQRHFEES